MKKLLCAFAVLALCSAAPRQLTAAEGAAPGPKAQVCHVTGQANDVLDLGYITVSFGRLIEVNDNAAPAHMDHGDSANFAPLEGYLKDALEAAYGLSLANADCYFVG